MKKISDAADIIRTLNKMVGIENLPLEEVISAVKYGLFCEGDEENDLDFWSETYYGIEDGSVVRYYTHCGYGQGCFPVTDSYDICEFPRKYSKSYEYHPRNTWKGVWGHDFF